MRKSKAMASLGVTKRQNLQPVNDLLKKKVVFSNEGFV
jgi:hypothetical protein